MQKPEYEAGLPLETWVLGAILTFVGLLAKACSFGKNELGITFAIGGFASASFGSLVFVNKFKQWVESLSNGSFDLNANSNFLILFCMQ